MLSHTIDEVGLPGTYRPPPSNEIIEENNLEVILGTLNEANEDFRTAALWIHPTRW